MTATLNIMAAAPRHSVLLWTSSYASSWLSLSFQAERCVWRVEGQGIKHNMAQRTIHTRLAAANDTRQQLEDEISRLRAELDRRPQVHRGSKPRTPLPSTDTADGILSHTSLKHILEQQQAMMAAQLTALNNLVEVSSSHRRQGRLPIVRGPPNRICYVQALEIRYTHAPGAWGHGLVDLRRLADAFGGLRRPAEGHGRRADDDRSPGSSPLRSSPRVDSFMADGTPGHRPRRRHRRTCRETGSLPPPSSKPSARPQGLFQSQPGGQRKHRPICFRVGAHP